MQHHSARRTDGSNGGRVVFSEKRKIGNNDGYSARQLCVVVTTAYLVHIHTRRVVLKALPEIVVVLNLNFLTGIRRMIGNPP